MTTFTPYLLFCQNFLKLSFSIKFSLGIAIFRTIGGKKSSSTLNQYCGSALVFFSDQDPDKNLNADLDP
jgi:hypothetical protein